MNNVSNNHNIIKGNNYIVDNSVKINETNSNIDFEQVEISRKDVNEYERKINITSLVTIVLGLITVVIDLIASVLVTENVTYTSVCILFMGISFIGLGLWSYIRYVLLFKRNKRNLLSLGRWNELVGNEMIAYKLSSKCNLCGGEVNIVIASYNSDNGVILKKPIGVCENSNKITKHYYEYDDITKKGKIMSQDEAKIYKL